MNTLSLFTAVKLEQPITIKISNAIRNYQHMNYFSIPLDAAVLACTTLTGRKMNRHTVCVLLVHTQVVIQTLLCKIRNLSF